MENFLQRLGSELQEACHGSEHREILFLDSETLGFAGWERVSIELNTGGMQKEYQWNVCPLHQAVPSKLLREMNGQPWHKTYNRFVSQLLSSSGFPIGEALQSECNRTCQTQ